MRAAALATILVVLALAGCTKAPAPAPSSTTRPPLDDGFPTTSTPAPSAATTPSSTTPPPPSPTPSTTTPPPTNETTTPPPVEPAMVDLTHDYATSDQNVTVVVPDDGRAYNITLNYSPSLTPLGTWACAGNLRIVVSMPNGTVWADVLGAPDPNAQPGAHCAVLTGPGLVDGGARVVPGKWHVAFTGPGTGVGLFHLAPARA